MITSAEQVSNFLSALGLGFILAVLYNAVVFVRKIFSKKKKAIIAQDIIFSLITGLLIFVFMQIFTEGEVRLDLISSSAIGFFVFYLSVGRYLEKTLEKLSYRISKIIHSVFYPFAFLKSKLLKLISVKKRKMKETFKVVKKQKQKNEKKLKKSKNKLEK